MLEEAHQQGFLASWCMRCAHSKAGEHANFSQVSPVCRLRTLSLRCLRRAMVSLSTTCLGRLMSPPSGPRTAAEGGTRSRSCVCSTHTQEQRA